MLTSSSHGLFVTFLVPPTVSVSPTNVTIVQRDSVHFNCSVGGDDPLVVTWTKYNSTTFPRNAVFNDNNHTLLLTNVSDGDEGVYRCTARNAEIVDPMQQESSANVLLAVQSKEQKVLSHS